MNYSMIRYILAWVFTFEGMFLMLPAVVGGIYGEKQGLVYLAIAAGCLLVGTLSRIRKIRSKVFYSKEGFVAVSLSWIIMSLVGALRKCSGTGSFPVCRTSSNAELIPS